MGLLDPVNYRVVRIDGDYAMLQKEGTQEEPTPVALARLPEGIRDGSRVQRVMMDYTLLD